MVIRASQEPASLLTDSVLDPKSFRLPEPARIRARSALPAPALPLPEPGLHSLRQISAAWPLSSEPRNTPASPDRFRWCRPSSITGQSEFSIRCLPSSRLYCCCAAVSTAGVGSVPTPSTLLDGIAFLGLPNQRRNTAAQEN